MSKRLLPLAAVLMLTTVLLARNAREEPDAGNVRVSPIASRVPPSAQDWIASSRKPGVANVQSGKPAAASKAAKASSFVVAAGPVNEVLLCSLKPRSIGPAVMGGRVSDIAIDPADPFTFYVALGTGGVMKTTDNGGSFSAIFEKEAVASVGAIAISPSNAKVVWVGTGEANDRNSSSWGNGVYRSEDAGSTWTHVGLDGSRVIARIAVHPKDPLVAWAAVVGDLWQPSPERGLYKTTDGGKSWKAVLQAPTPFTDRVGCGDVVIDPSDPSILYAAMYARRRQPWAFASGPASTDGKDLGGIFKSTDGGSTWRKLTKGLPGSSGRIGLDVYRKNSKIVYATIQSYEGAEGAGFDVRSRRGGVFRSDDGGESWTRMSPLNPRPFYFSQIRVDPENEKRVYVLGFTLHVSEDGGSTFREDRFQKIHPDCHALAIDIRNPKRVILGTDGGVYQTFDGGAGWEHLNRMAAGEFYRISLDMNTPYRICGGLQDNLNWLGPSRTFSKEGIVNSDWINLGGGDGFYCVFDQEDPRILYAESQGGEIFRFDLSNGETKELRPSPAEGQNSYRFHWNSPLIGSVHEKGRMYLGGNRIFELSARGEEWKIISPDLSTQDPLKTTAVGSGAETFGVVYALAESPVEAGLLWAGTDDGKIWMTRDGGSSWIDLTKTLPESAKGQFVSRIEPGHHDARLAYLAVDAHRSGTNVPLAYRTADGGKSWQSIASNLPPDGPVKVVREDPRNANVLYAGTEFGLFVSLDRGGSWTRIKDLPTVAVDDLAVHSRENDLVIATHGRSLFILDDIGPLQQLTPEIRDTDAHLFPPRPVFGRHLLQGFADWMGKAVFRGENPPEGAIVNVYVKEFTGDPVKLEIAKAGGGPPVANLTAPGTAGINRLTWDLKPTKDLLNEYGGEGQKFVRSGEYEVTMTHGKTKQTEKLKVEIASGIETR